MNPFVEYFGQHLRWQCRIFPMRVYSGISDVGCPSDQEKRQTFWRNYVLALGIRGFKKWDEKWVRVYRECRRKVFQN